MSHLEKTNAIVLTKLNFGDTSKIVTLFTEEFGKETCIIKGGRSSKSKFGAIIDVMNHVQVIFYKKQSREVQLISQADLISHFPHIKQNLDSLKYASGVLELLNSLTISNEQNSKLFRGTIKILNLMDKEENHPQLLFVKYLMFFIDELGYSLKEYECKICGNPLDENSDVLYNQEKGFMCVNCGKHQLINFEFSKELFKLLICLSGRQNECKYSIENLNRLVSFFEKFLKYHIPEFKGIKSIYTL
ncbi:MAG: DNA repair protein RecO [Melioribacteraceae bacterium]|nr:DNA repair protein RecO [Melioribacteraceae bacterium]